MKKLIVSAIVLGVVVIGSVNADAMAVYNKTTKTIHVTLNCGFFCGNTWDIPPGGKESRPGEGGLVDVWVKDGSTWHAGDVTVDDHGWVKVYCDNEACTCAKVISWHENGSVDDQGSGCK
ncbi:MAG: hypothetical protein KAV87_46535 [Desulfobacteraceae bacterium]|nr:hypothetical protein [Desulfobacteraceae bacterium]